MSGLRDHWRELRFRLAPPYWRELERAIGPAGSLLDVGCGRASPVARFRAKLGRVVGVDAHPEAVEEARRAGVHDEVVAADVRELREAFPAGSFEVVAAVDLLEHLPQDEGRLLLGELESIAQQRVVVFTPNGFVEQGAREGNVWQVHRSGWSADELRQLGYRVSGVHGLRVLRGEEAQIRPRPRRFWALVADLSQPLVRRVPRLAYHLLCVKDVDAG